jgi:histidine triad (HIT) family protein
MTKREAEPCIFCSIVRKEAPAAFVADRGGAVAFLTIGPLTPGHTLIVPRSHAVTLLEVPPAEWQDVTLLALEVARLQRDHLGATGNTLFLASDRDGEQSVFHLHLHVVARRPGDGLDLTSWWTPRVRPAEATDLTQVAGRLRNDVR